MSTDTTILISSLIAVAMVIAYRMANKTRRPESLPIRKRMAAFVGVSLSLGIKVLYGGYVILTETNLTGNQRRDLFFSTVFGLILFLGVLLALFISQWRYERNARITMVTYCPLMCKEHRV